MRSDEDIKRAILGALDADPEVSMAEIGVVVHDGAVTLTGIVETYPERLAAERAASGVAGVIAIAQDIKVALSGERVTDDSEVARRIARVLEWDPAIVHESVHATVRNGDVVLTGDAQWEFQRETIENHVARIGGVRSVTNDIRVPLRPADG